MVPMSTTNRSDRVVAFRCAATVFLSAFLLFQVQLLIGKYILPSFGGAPAVWNTCMLCFQVLLLLGYAYAHVLSRQKRPRVQGKVHIGLLLASLVVLLAVSTRWDSPLTPGPGWKPLPSDNPSWKILELLGVTVALPFFLLSTTGPLVQKWLSLSSSGKSPYRLYALSNAGSLLGLLSYPFLVEWAFTIKHQAWLWSLGYALFVLLGAAIAWQLPGSAKAHGVEESSDSTAPGLSTGPGLGRCLLWVALSTCSSVMLLATTNLLCQDIAVIPLLWVLPLSIYLLSFIVAFESNRWYRRSIFWPFYFLALGLALKTIFLGSHDRAPLQIVVFSLALLAVCMVCHGELARSKPSPNYLTSFYFMVAIGGALGGVFVVLIAPHIFRGFWEFQIALLGCGFLLFLAFLLEDRSGRTEQSAWVATLAILMVFLLPQLPGLFPKLGSLSLLTKEYYTGSLAAAFLVSRELVHRRRNHAVHIPADSRLLWKPAASAALLGLFAIIAYAHTLFGTEYVLFQERNFFGVKYVLDSFDVIQLNNGSTMHGAEFKDSARRDIPTFYYRRNSGIGLLLSNYSRGASGQERLRVGLIGLGVGTLAAYGQPGDRFRFYEIDPVVIQLSVGPKRYFHFLEDSQSTVETVLGDARLSLEREATQGELQKFDVLAVDAFSGDAIPVHLLTREAMGIYLQHLRGPDSVIAFHVSNRYLDLAPVLVGLSEYYHLQAVEIHDTGNRWILLSQHPTMLRLPNLAEQAFSITLNKRPLLWTDDYSNLFQVLR
jgi:hypothetical protein